MCVFFNVYTFQQNLVPACMDFLGLTSRQYVHLRFKVCFFLSFFCSTKLLRVVGVAGKSGSPWRLLRRSTGLLSSEKGLTSPHPESWKRHRKEDCEETDASVSAPWCQLSIPPSAKGQWSSTCRLLQSGNQEAVACCCPPPTTPSCFPRVRDATAPNSAGEVPI